MDKWLADNIEYPIMEWRAELQRLVNDIKTKLDNDQRTIFLIDEDLKKTGHNNYYKDFTNKSMDIKEKIIGCYSPIYSRVFFRERSKGGTRSYSFN